MICACTRVESDTIYRATRVIMPWLMLWRLQNYCLPRRNAAVVATTFLFGISSRLSDSFDCAALVGCEHAPVAGGVEREVDIVYETGRAQTGGGEDSNFLGILGNCKECACVADGKIVGFKPGLK